MFGKAGHWKALPHVAHRSNSSMGANDLPEGLSSQQQRDAQIKKRAFWSLTKDA
jgi:hypothetical protein